MNKNFITVITTASAVVLILLGTKFAVGTPKNDVSALTVYKAAKISKITSDEEESIGVSGRKLHTVKADGIIDGKTKITVIQEYIAGEKTAAKKISVGDEVVVMQQTESDTPDYWVFNSYSNTAVIVVLAAIAAILLAAVAGIKSIKTFLKTLFTIAAVLLVIIPSFAFSHGTAVCAVIAFVVIIGTSNFICSKDTEQSIICSAFTALSAAAAALISVLGCKLVGLNSFFDISFLTSSVSASFVKVPFKSAAVISAALITLLFSQTLCPMLCSERAASNENKKCGFWKTMFLILSKKSQTAAKMIAGFALGILPTISLLYASGHSLTAIFNSEYVLFAVSTVLFAIVGCLISAVLAALFIKYGFLCLRKEKQNNIAEETL